MEILQRKVQSGGMVIVRLHCGRADWNSGSRVWKMFQIFLIAVQMGCGQALVLPIVPVQTLLGSEMVLLEMPLPLQEALGHAAAPLLLELVLRLVVHEGVLPLTVSVLLAVGLPLVLHPPVLEPHLHLLLC